MQIFCMFSTFLSLSYRVIVDFKFIKNNKNTNVIPCIGLFIIILNKLKALKLKKILKSSNNSSLMMHYVKNLT